MKEEIFIKAQNGDKDSIELILNSIEPFIISQCRKIFLSNYDFLDLKQIAYMAAIKGIKKMDTSKGNGCKSYLMKCVHNSLKYEARKILSKPRINSIENKDSDGITFTDKLESDDNTEDTVLQSLDNELLGRAFLSLTSEYKDIVSYYISNSHGGLKNYADMYSMDYRKVRYKKDKALKLMKDYMEKHNVTLIEE